MEIAVRKSSGFTSAILIVPLAGSIQAPLKAGTSLTISPLPFMKQAPRFSDLSACSESVRQFSGLMERECTPEGTGREEVTHSSSVLMLTKTPVSDSPAAGFRLAGSGVHGSYQRKEPSAGQRAETGEAAGSCRSHRERCFCCPRAPSCP